MLAGLGAASAQTPAVLNLSHDLVPNGIAAQNMVPNSSSLDSRPLFEAGVAYASKNHIPTVMADTGSYYFLTLHSGGNAHVFLSGISNVTVDLQYSDLYFAQGNIIGINATDCTNLTLQNFTADYVQLPFTQLTVTGVNTTARTIAVKPLENYATPMSIGSVVIPSTSTNDGFYAFVFRGGVELSTTGRMPAAAPTSNTSIQITGTDPWTQAANLSTIQAGDTLVLNYRAGVGTIFANASPGFTVHNVSVYASGFIGVNTIFGSNITIDHVQVIPRPGTDRLIATNADGIHLSWAGANNTVTNNTVRRGCDDGLAIDGQWYATVNTPNTGATVQVARKGPSPLAVGQSFDFINITNATVIGTATITAENPPVAQQAGTSGELIALTLDHTIAGLQTNFGVTPSDPTLRGSGTVFSNNLVQQEVFARGMLIGGVDSVSILNNLLESTNQSGILLEQDEGLTYDYKTGPLTGIAIQNNIVDHALGFGVPSNNLLSFAGAINVVAYDQHFNWVSTSSLSNISITGNFVSNSAGTGIRMENVNGGQLTGDTVLNYALEPTAYLWYLPGCCETLAQVESDFMQPVLVVSSTGVTNSNNTTSNAATFVANVSDADGGYRLAPGSIAVAYGQNLASGIKQAGGATLPTSLGGINVTVKDSAGVSRLAGLYYVSSGQVDYVVPMGTAAGVATVTVGSTPSAAFIGTVGPGLFSADGSGTGVAAALAVLASPDGTQAPEPVFECGSSGCASTPMSLGGPGDTLVVELYGTGISGRSSLLNVVAEIDGVPATVAYAGAQGQYAGLDQVNVYIPASLAGAGEVPLVLTVDGVTANVVTVNIK
jgi:uncharacterized protein (TIGR03437 family)